MSIDANDFRAAAILQVVAGASTVRLSGRPIRHHDSSQPSDGLRQVLSAQFVDNDD
jgi:hypothetical protein